MFSIFFLFPRRLALPCHGVIGSEFSTESAKKAPCKVKCMFCGIINTKIRRWLWQWLAALWHRWHCPGAAQWAAACGAAGKESKVYEILTSALKMLCFLKVLQKNVLCLGGC